MKSRPNASPEGAERAQLGIVPCRVADLGRLFSIVVRAGAGEAATLINTHL
jgi:hypothetical protein